MLRSLIPLAAAAALLAACGGRTASDGSSGLRFAPASRWNTAAATGLGCEAGGAAASTGTIANRPNDFPEETIKQLSPDAILVWACANPPSGNGNFEPASLPLQLADARVDAGWEGQPNPDAPQYLLWRSANGYDLDVRVFFGTQHPSGAQLASAQDELDRLEVPQATQAGAAVDAVTIGRSVRGRPIVAYERGDPSAPVTLVVGVIHGTEPAGLAVIRRLRTMQLPAGVHLWLVPTVNPDGLAAGTRQNAYGVDLNRNWPVDWKHNGRPWDGYYSGPRPLSEPENRAMRAFILRVRPELTIWYHQPLDVVYGSDPHVAELKRYARLSGLPYKRLAAPPGAATRWERTRFPAGAHFVVEFPAGRISAATARRNASAVLALAPRPKEAMATTPLALVTVESENRLLAVDLVSGRVVRWWTLPADPENVEAYAGEAAVVSTRAGAVTLLDTRTLRVRRVIRGFGSPHIAAFSPDGEYLYVTDDARGQLDVIRGRVIRRIFVGYGAHHLTFSPDQKRLWIVLGERARSIAVVDTHNPAHPRLIGHVDPLGLAHDAAFTPDGRHVWVAYDEGRYLRVFDARTRRPGARLYAGSPPAHVRFDDASGLARYRRFAYVTSGNDATVRVFDWRTLGVVRTLPTAPGSFNLSVDRGLVATSSLTGGELTAFRSGRRLLAERVAASTRDVALVP